jgi:nitroreductase
MYSYLKNRITTKWWQNKIIEEEKINALLETAYLSPSKQNSYEWKCIVITNSEEGKRIKKHLYENLTWVDSNDVKLGSAQGTRRYNGQYLAPLLFVWVSRFLEIDLKNIKYARERLNLESRRLHLYINVGIVSGAVMTAAEDMGLNTGFGLCHDYSTVADLLGYKGEHAILVLGVGYGEEHTHTAGTGFDKEVIIDQKIAGVDFINLPVEIKNSTVRSKKPEKNTLIQLI